MDLSETEFGTFVKAYGVHALFVVSIGKVIFSEKYVHYHYIIIMGLFYLNETKMF